ncbi:hypothetical protein SEA_JACKO_82 [Microbacterium phage Jacko]|nr:hypothetical protein SEA_JACKO_82 [Microbacterium phage Jacko]
MSICENYEKRVGTLTLEASIYEDGYVLVTVVDERGEEIDSLDGTALEDDTAAVRADIEEKLLLKHLNE